MSRLRLWGLGALTLLACAMLALIGVVVVMLAAHVGPDGRVPGLDAAELSILVMSFREIVASIRALLDGATTTALTDQLAASTPIAPPAVAEQTPAS